MSRSWKALRTEPIEKRGRNALPLRKNVNSQHRFRANSIEQRQVEGWVRDFAQRAGMPDTVRHALDLALEESITNVISYGQEDSAEHWIEIRFAVTGGVARGEVEDGGREFNPLTLPPVLAICADTLTLEVVLRTTLT